MSQSGILLLEDADQHACVQRLGENNRSVQAMDEIVAVQLRLARRVGMMLSRG